MKHIYQGLGFTEAAENLTEIKAARDEADILKDLTQYATTGRMQVFRPAMPLPMIHGE